MFFFFFFIVFHVDDLKVATLVWEPITSPITQHPFDQHLKAKEQGSKAHSLLFCRQRL